LKPVLNGCYASDTEIMKTSQAALVGLVVLVLIVGGAYYLFIKKLPTMSSVVPETASSSSPGSSSTETSIPGMSEYTDSTYGFTFWYPSALQITQTSLNDSTDFPGGVEVQSLQVGSQGGTVIHVVNSATDTITDEPSNHASPIAQTEYFYDRLTNTWMEAFPQGNSNGGSDATTTANISQTTISGLFMLPSGLRFDATIIPLSTTRFLVINDGGGSSFTSELAKTVAEVGSSINPSEQVTAVQAEMTAYKESITKNI
jgi:hypothetical protein